MDPSDPMSPVSGGSRLRDVGRTVTNEAAGHIERLKKSERTKEVVDKTVDWTAHALEDPTATADLLREQAKRLWQEDEKVVAVRERTKEMFNNALQDEAKMQKVRAHAPRGPGRRSPFLSNPEPSTTHETRRTRRGVRRKPHARAIE
jgi:hypothetical protein